MIQFNVPPNWREYLPADFNPQVDWKPDPQWGAPPAGWYMWVNKEDGSPVMPPPEYAQNPYLYMYVMPPSSPGTSPTGSLSTQTMANRSGSVSKTPKKMSTGVKIGLGAAAVLVIFAFAGALGGGNEQPTSSPEPSATISNSPQSVAESTTAPTRAEDDQVAKEAESRAAVEAEAEAKREEEARKEAEASARAEEEREKAEAGTVSQQNALRTAENYLSFTAFSREGLIDQLEFEQFSNADATWAVDRVEVDWNEQAAKSAENYLNFTSFSKAGLIDQLIFEGFTRKQAEFGVSQTGL